MPSWSGCVTRAHSALTGYGVQGHDLPLRQYWSQCHRRARLTYTTLASQHYSHQSNHTSRPSSWNYISSSPRSSSSKYTYPYEGSTDISHPYPTASSTSSFQTTTPSATFSSYVSFTTSYVAYPSRRVVPPADTRRTRACRQIGEHPLLASRRLRACRPPGEHLQNGTRA